MTRFSRPKLWSSTSPKSSAFANALWRGEDRSHLSDRSDAGLIRAWARARQRWLGDGLDVVGGPSVDLLT